MPSIFDVVSKGQQALAILALLKPVLGENSEIVETVSGIVGKALTGLKFGATGYGALVEELDGVIAEMRVIEARGGVTGGDFRAEVAAIGERGARLDAVLARLKG